MKQRHQRHSLAWRSYRNFLTRHFGQPNAQYGLGVEAFCEDWLRHANMRFQQIDLSKILMLEGATQINDGILMMGPSVQYGKDSVLKVSRTKARGETSCIYHIDDAGLFEQEDNGNPT